MTRPPNITPAVVVLASAFVIGTAAWIRAAISADADWAQLAPGGFALAALLFAALGFWLKRWLPITMMFVCMTFLVVSFLLQGGGEALAFGLLVSIFVVGMAVFRLRKQFQ